MEVDDIEQNLLQQFSCMGTTDHEVLISQLRKLVGDDVNETTASFFLDMNNWYDSCLLRIIVFLKCSPS